MTQSDRRNIRIRHYFEYVFMRLAIAFLQTIPLRWCESLADKVSWLIADVIKFRHRVVHENLSHVFPDQSEADRQQLARDMWRHMFLMICEISQASRKIHDTNWRDYITIPDKRLMTSYFLDWRPVILLAGHLGNFELALYGTGVLGIPTYAVVRPLDNPLLDRWLRQFRESRGQFMLPTEGSAPELQRVLDAGALLSMLGDQHAGRKGCWVDFMGRPASCHKAVALFTLTQDVPMIVTYSIRRDRPLTLEIGCNGIADPETLPDELRDVKSLTQWYNRQLEEVVRRRPTEYWWMHRRWKEKPRRRSTRNRPPSTQGGVEKEAA